MDVSRRFFIGGPGAPAPGADGILAARPGAFAGGAPLLAVPFRGRIPAPLAAGPTEAGA